MRAHLYRRGSAWGFLTLALLLAGCGGTAEPESASKPETPAQRPPDAPAPAPAPTPNLQPVINGKPLSEEQRAAFVATDGTQP
jgi:hypothetical protein